MRHKVGVLFTFLAAFLFVLNIYAIFRLPIEREDIPAKSIPGVHLRTITVSHAKQRFNQLKASPDSPQQKIQNLLELVSQSFIRNENYRIEFLDNWLLWLLGQWRKSLLFTQDADLLWHRGAGLCLQSSMLFSAKAKELGFDARLVLLTGHVVSELNLPEKGWVVVDSDLGLMWYAPIAEFGNTIPKEAVSEKVQSLGFSKEYAQSIADIYVSQQDNSVVSYPMREDRYRVETIVEWLKWLLPLFLMVLGLKNFLCNAKDTKVAKEDPSCPSRPSR